MEAELAALPNSERLLLELEFVQNLCNAKYLLHLAQNRFLQDERFLAFLRYLRYWKQPQYTRLLAFPQCLAFLDALCENEPFRKELTVAHFSEFVHQQQGSHWLVDTAWATTSVTPLAPTLADSFVVENSLPISAEQQPEIKSEPTRGDASEGSPL